MNVYVGQIYIEAGASYPFSAAWQRYLSQELTRCVSASAYFEERFGVGQNLIFRVSAKKGIPLVELKGPAHFKRDGDVEYTVFLPHTGEVPTREACQRALQDLLVGVSQILVSLQIAIDDLKARSQKIVEHVLVSPEMFETG